MLDMCACVSCVYLVRKGLCTVWSHFSYSTAWIAFIENQLPHQAILSPVQSVFLPFFLIEIPSLHHPVPNLSLFHVILFFLDVSYSLRSMFAVQDVPSLCLYGSASLAEAENDVKLVFPMQQTLALIKPSAMDQKGGTFCTYLSRDGECGFESIKPHPTPDSGLCQLSQKVSQYAGVCPSVILA